LDTLRYKGEIVAEKKKEGKEKIGKYFKVADGKIERTRRNCPKCGIAVFLADHKSRFSCGKCGYTEFKSKQA